MAYLFSAPLLLASVSTTQVFGAVLFAVEGRIRTPGIDWTQVPSKSLLISGHRTTSSEKAETRGSLSQQMPDLCPATSSSVSRRPIVWLPTDPPATVLIPNGPTFRFGPHHSVNRHPGDRNRVPRPLHHIFRTIAVPFRPEYAYYILFAIAAADRTVGLDYRTLEPTLVSTERPWRSRLSAEAFYTCLHDLYYEENIIRPLASYHYILVDGLVAANVTFIWKSDPLSIR